MTTQTGVPSTIAGAHVRRNAPRVDKHLLPEIEWLDGAPPAGCPRGGDEMALPLS